MLAVASGMASPTQSATQSFAAAHMMLWFAFTKKQAT